MQRFLATINGFQRLKVGHAVGAWDQLYGVGSVDGTRRVECHQRLR